MKSKLDKSAKSLMACDLTNSVVNLFGETFLVAYFLQISNENIIQVSIFYIILYTLLGIGSILLGNIIKSKPQKRVVIYRVGIIVKSIYILLIVLFKEDIRQYFIVFAIFYSYNNTNYIGDIYRVNIFYKYINIYICINIGSNNNIITYRYK